MQSHSVTRKSLFLYSFSGTVQLKKMVSNNEIIFQSFDNVHMQVNMTRSGARFLVAYIEKQIKVEVTLFLNPSDIILVHDTKL